MGKNRTGWSEIVEDIPIEEELVPVGLRAKMRLVKQGENWWEFLAELDGGIEILMPELFHEEELVIINEYLLKHRNELERNLSFEFVPDKLEL